MELLYWCLAGVAFASVIRNTLGWGRSAPSCVRGGRVARLRFAVLGSPIVTFAKQLRCVVLAALMSLFSSLGTAGVAYAQCRRRVWLCQWCSCFV